MKVYDYTDQRIKDFYPSRSLLSQIDRMMAESQRTMVKVWFKPIDSPSHAASRYWSNLQPWRIKAWFEK